MREKMDKGFKNDRIRVTQRTRGELPINNFNNRGFREARRERIQVPYYIHKAIGEQRKNGSIELKKLDRKVSFEVMYTQTIKKYIKQAEKEGLSIASSVLRQLLHSHINIEDVASIAIEPPNNNRETSLYLTTFIFASRGGPRKDGDTLITRIMIKTKDRVVRDLCGSFLGAMEEDYHASRGRLYNYEDIYAEAESNLPKDQSKEKLTRKEKAKEASSQVTAEKDTTEKGEQGTVIERLANPLLEKFGFKLGKTEEDKLGAEPPPDQTQQG